MAFATIAKLGLNPDEVHLVFDSGAAFSCPQCKMADFLERVLSRGGSALHLEKEGSLCLENLILPIPGSQSFMLRNKGYDDPLAARCSNSPVLLGFSDYVKDAFAVPLAFSNRRSVFSGAETLPELGGPKLRITLPLRTGAGKDGKPRDFNRKMTNQDELVGALNGHVHAQGDGQRGRVASKQFLLSEEEYDEEGHEEDATAATQMMMELLGSELRRTGEFDVRTVELQSMTIDDQVKLFSDTDLIIAPHGASLTWQILLPECGQVIEFCDGADRHFVNIAHYAGNKHTCLQGPSGWGAKSFIADVDATLARVKEIKGEWNTCRARHGR